MRFEKHKAGKLGKLKVSKSFFIIFKINSYSKDSIKLIFIICCQFPSIRNHKMNSVSDKISELDENDDAQQHIFQHNKYLIIHREKM